MSKDFWAWNSWFAWYPIKDTSGLWYWLCFVERKQEWNFKGIDPESAFIGWIYRK